MPVTSNLKDDRHRRWTPNLVDALCVGINFTYYLIYRFPSGCHWLVGIAGFDINEWTEGVWWL